MKTKIFIAVLLSICISGFFTMKTNSPLEDIVFENTEALGSGEGGDRGCISGGNLKCGGSSGYSNYY